MPQQPLSLRRSIEGTRHITHPASIEIISGIVRLLRGMGHWICRPRESRPLDNLTDHMLRDIGIESAEAKRESTVGFWRRR